MTSAEQVRLSQSRHGAGMSSQAPSTSRRSSSSSPRHAASRAEGIGSYTTRRRKKRRGRVLGMHPAEDGMQTIEADVPVSEMHDFTTWLRQSTQGRGSFTFDFARYEPLPSNLEGKVIEEAKKFMDIKSDDE